MDRLYRTIFVELTEKELDDIFGEWDLDGNGLVSFEDFVKSQQIRRAVKVRELGRRGEMERRYTTVLQGGAVFWGGRGAINLWVHLLSQRNTYGNVTGH